MSGIRLNGYEPSFNDDSAIEQITKHLTEMDRQKGYSFTNIQQIREEDPYNEDTLQISDNFNKEFGTPDNFNNKKTEKTPYRNSQNSNFANQDPNNYRKMNYEDDAPRYNNPPSKNQNHDQNRNNNNMGHQNHDQNNNNMGRQNNNNMDRKNYDKDRYNNDSYNNPSEEQDSEDYDKKGYRWALKKKKDEEKRKAEGNNHGNKVEKQIVSGNEHGMIKGANRNQIRNLLCDDSDDNI